MAGALSHGVASTGRFLRKEFVATWPVFLFFLVGFLLLITIVKLALAEFSIAITALSNAVVGAGLAAKAALVLDETPLAASLEHYPQVIAVAVKTFIYGTAGLMLGYLERFLEALHKLHNVDAAIQYMIEHANHYRLLAWVLGVSIVFALYFAFSEISRRMGEGSLWDLFFETPGSRDSSGQLTNISVVKPHS
jgi:hypothetical protein